MVSVSFSETLSDLLVSCSTVQDAAAAAVEEVADQARDIMSDLADATLDETPADTPYDDVVMVTTGSRHPSRHGYGGDSDSDDEGGGGGGGDGRDDGNEQNDQEDDELDGYIDWGLVDDAAGGDRVAGGTPAIPTRAPPPGLLTLPGESLTTDPHTPCPFHNRECRRLVMDSTGDQCCTR